MKPEDMKSRLQLAYPNAQVDVIDLTGTHDHYQVAISSPVFKGMSRIEQHKHVMNVFDPELKSGEVHALTIKTSLPLGEKP